jgi:UDP-N-acetylglucosamine acyltransferase
MKVHPTAIVCQGAELSDDVEIGAHAIIGGGVRLGPGCVVQAHAILEGRTTLGARNFVGYGAVIGATPQDFAFRETVSSEVLIGEGNTFREYVTIHRGTKEGSATVVGNNCYLMVGTHLGHNVRLGDNVVIANNCLLAGYVEIGDGAVLGGGTVFHQFLRVGRLAMVRGGTRFGKDIPPYVSADGENLLSGINAVGLRRAGFSQGARLEVKRAFKLVFWSGINVSQALERAKDETWSADARQFFDFIAASKRGVCAANRVPQGDGADAQEEP